MARAKKVDALKGVKEPVFIVKPVARGYGLDYLHVTLVALVVILAGLAFALSFMKPAVVLKCANGTTANGTCATSVHTSNQVLLSVEKALANYQSVNSSLSLLPYYSLVNRANASYMPSSGRWLVVIPYIDPYNTSITLNFSMLVSDANLTILRAFIQSINPRVSYNETVVGPGSIEIDGAPSCTTTKPVDAYMITDPYAPGAISALRTAFNASRRYGSEINMSYYIVFSRYAISRYQGFGEAQTQAIGDYIFCASKQRGFGDFLSNLSIAFTGQPLSNYTLSDVAQGSSLNMSEMDSCLAGSTQALDYQAQLASKYNIVSTPQFVVDCRYLTIPQTLGYAINYSLSHEG